MNKKKHPTLKWIVIASILLATVSGFILMQLIPIPFGSLFKSVLYLFSAALVLTLILTAVICFRSVRRWLKFVGLVPALLAVIVGLITLIINMDYRILYFRSLSPKPSKAEWIEDLHYLAGQMAEKHADLFSLVSKEKLGQTVSGIEKRIPGLSDSEIQMELFRLAALPNDNHTFPFIMFPCFDLHSFPFKVFGFPEGWTIVDVGRGYRDFIGARILKIGSVNIEDIYEKYPLFLATENESSRKERFTYMMVMSEWLAYHHIINNIARADFTLKKISGEELVVSVPSVQYFPHFLWSNAFSIDNDEPPLFTNYRRDWYQFELLEKSKCLYIQFNQCVDQPGRETVDAFVRRLEDFSRDYEFERCVVDIRSNDGGNRVWDELVRFLRDNEKINQHGRLFVLIGRRTFSSAVIFATQVQLQTKAIFIGENTGQGTVFYSGPQFVELPHSRLVFAVSGRLTVAGLPFDDRKALTPDILVPFTYKDFIQGRDPIMEAALDYSPSEEESIVLAGNVIKTFTGRYLLTPTEVMDVKQKETSLQAVLSDFIPGSNTRFQSDLYPVSENRFKTDIPGVTVRFYSGMKRLILNWMGKEKILNRAADDYVLAMEYFSEGDIEKGCQTIREKKELHLKQYPDLEERLNSMGYVQLRRDYADGALRIFRLNVDLFPESFNAYDSYGEALLKNGDKEEAIANYRKSLELNPDSESGNRVLRELGVEI